jgi:Phage gp6-like head-tail connector protein
MSVSTGYCLRDEAKATIGVDDANDDALIDACIQVASRNIENWTGRRFVGETSATPRTFASLSPHLVYVNDFWDTADLVVATDTEGTGTYATTLTTSQYTLNPSGGIGPEGSTGWPYSGIHAISGTTFPHRWGWVTPDNIKVTAKWGWAQVPDDVQMACRLLTQQMYRAKDAPFGVAGVADLGIIRIRQNSVVLDLLSGYLRRPVLVA